MLDDLVDIHWADREDDNKDDFPDSILNFIILAKDAREWKATSSVIVESGDFPDNEDTSDHRPVEATFEPSGTNYQRGDRVPPSWMMEIKP